MSTFNLMQPCLHLSRNNVLHPEVEEAREEKVIKLRKKSKEKKKSSNSNGFGVLFRKFVFIL